MNTALTIVAGILVTIIVAILIGQFLRRRALREADKYDGWRRDLLNRPITEELSKIKNLNMIGETEELFEKWRQDWDAVVTEKIPETEAMLLEIEELINKYQFSKVNKKLAGIYDILESAENDVAMILNELEKLVGSEEKNSEEILQLQEQFKEEKKNLLAHRMAFDKAEPQLKDILNEVSQLFVTYEEATVKGNYLQAREIVLTIGNHLNRLNHLTKVIPDLLVEAQTNLPTQLEELTRGYNEMKDGGFVLDHLLLDKEVEEIHDSIAQAEEFIFNLQTDDSDVILTIVKQRLDTLYDSLEAEVLARSYVNVELITVHDLIQSVREANMKTKDETQFVLQSYQVLEKDLESQRYIEKHLIMLTKRFNSLQHKTLEQKIAFTVLQQELQAIKEEIIDLQEMQQHYNVTLETLRKDENIARKAIEDMKKQVAEAKYIIQRSNVPGLPEGYQVDLQNAMKAIIASAKSFEQKPLNMEYVHATLQEAQVLVEDFHTASIDLIQDATLVERVIQYGNRHRRNEKVSSKLIEAENLFRVFQYKKALELATQAVEEAEPGGIEKLRAILKEEEAIEV